MAKKADKPLSAARLEKVSLKKLSEEFGYGDIFDFNSDGISDWDDDEFGKAYLLGNDKHIMFISEGFKVNGQVRESVLHKQLREVIEANPAIVDHGFIMSIRLHKPSSSKYKPYWTLDRVQIKKDAVVEAVAQQKTIVEYV